MRPGEEGVDHVLTLASTGKTSKVHQNRRQQFLHFPWQEHTNLLFRALQVPISKPFYLTRPAGSFTAAAFAFSASSWRGEHGLLDGPELFFSFSPFTLALVLLLSILQSCGFLLG